MLIALALHDVLEDTHAMITATPDRVPTFPQRYFLLWVLGTIENMARLLAYQKNWKNLLCDNHQAGAAVERGDGESGVLRFPPPPAWSPPRARVA